MGSDLLKQKNSDKFRKLFYDGDISDYGTQSEADAALCALIAFRTGPNLDAIDAVFRASALYREKWEREDLCYLLIWDSGEQGLLKYVYDGGCYRLRSTDLFLGVIKQYIGDYDEELVKMSKVNAVYQHIITDLTYIGQDDLDADEDLINYRNGLLSLKGATPFLIPHAPAVLSAIPIPCDWIGRETPLQYLTVICTPSPTEIPSCSSCFWNTSESASPISKAADEESALPGG